MSEDQAKADDETRMRQSLGLTNGSRPIVSDETQRMARQAIRSQTSAREYAERHLVRAEQTIEELRAKVHAIAREKAVAIQAARAAHDAQVRAEQGRRAAETALINAKSAAESARHDAHDARATTQDLRVKLAAANQAVEALQADLEQERQAKAALEQLLLAAQVPAKVPPSVVEDTAMPSEPPIKRPRGRPPGKRSASASVSHAKQRSGSTAAQEPVKWWNDGWTPSA